jgi:hypothetical protein
MMKMKTLATLLLVGGFSLFSLTGCGGGSCDTTSESSLVGDSNTSDGGAPGTVNYFMSDNNVTDQGSAITLNNGRLYVSGMTGAFPTQNLNFTIWCYEENGTKCSDFGTNGVQFTNQTGYSTYSGGGIKIDESAILFAAGYSTGSPISMQLWSFDIEANTTNSSFPNGNESVLDHIETYTYGYDLAVGANRIYIAGRTGDGNPYGISDSVMWCYENNGTKCSDFGTSGVVRYARNGGSSSNDGAYGIELGSDQKLYMISNQYNSGSSYGDVLRYYEANGSIDATYGTAGVASYTGGSFFAMTLDTDKNVFAAGKTFSPVSMLVVKFDSNGTLDPNFGSAGELIYSELNPSGGFSGINGIIVDSDGNIAVCGYIYDSGTYTAVVLKFDAEGQYITTLLHETIASSASKMVFNEGESKLYVTGWKNDDNNIRHETVWSIDYQ